MVKLRRIIISIFLAAIIFLAYCYFSFPATNNPAWGINFSTGQAQYLGYNPSVLFARILSDLHPKKIRLTAYWEDIEAKQGTYDFSEIDGLLNQAQAAGAKVTLVLGRKQPRWPECHEPSWYNSLSDSQKQQAVLSMVSAAVDHFKTFPAIERWQVENEPFFDYGADCPVSTAADVSAEIAEIKATDLRPVVVTDSGEKGGWLTAAKLADIFGTTMYRTVYQGSWHRYFTYPLPPAFYRIRAGLVKLLTGQKNVIDVELQAEPWLQVDISSLTPDQMTKLLSLQSLQNNINYAKATGLPEHYLWGAEWWYYMADHGHPEYVAAIKNLLNP